MSNELFEFGPELGGRLLGLAFFLQGVILTQAPGPQAKIYGWGTTVSDLWLMDMTGTTILVTGAASCWLLWLPQNNNRNTHQAIGLEGAIWLVAFLRCILNHSFRNVGVGMDKVVFLVASTALLVFAGFLEPAWADGALWAVVVLYTLSAVRGIVLPEASAKFWGTDWKGSDKMKYETRHFNVFFLIQHVQNMLLLSGFEPYLAIGWASVIATIFFYDGFFISRAFHTTLKPMPGYGFWILFFTIINPMAFLPMKGFDHVVEAGAE